MNLKLETEKEKIVPFYQEGKEEEEESDQGPEPPKEESSSMFTAEGGSVGEWNYLENFYKRYAVAVLSEILARILIGS